MRTLRDILRSLNRMPRGYSADGRMLGLGLASAMQAQQADGDDARHRALSVEDSIPAPRHDDDRIVEAR